MWLYLVLAFFWLVSGVIIQVFWHELSRHLNFPVGREAMGVVFFILFSYNFVRWRMSRRVRHAPDDDTPPPRPRVVKEYDPTFDFSKDDDSKKNPPN